MDKSRPNVSTVEAKEVNKMWEPRPGNPICVKKTKPRQTHNTNENTTKKRHRVVYHKKNDLSDASGMHLADAQDFDANNAVLPKQGLDDFTYGEWKSAMFPSSDDNLVRGMAEALSLIMQVAANGPESVDHEKAFDAVQFLSTVKNNYGEYPPNVLGFLEFIDYYTRNDSTEKAAQMIQPL